MSTFGGLRVLRGGVSSLFERIDPKCMIGGRSAARTGRIEVVKVCEVCSVVGWVVWVHGAYSLIWWLISYVWCP